MNQETREGYIANHGVSTMLRVVNRLNNRTRKFHVEYELYRIRLMSPEYEIIRFHVDRAGWAATSGFRVCLAVKSTPSMSPLGVVKD